MGGGGRSLKMRFEILSSVSKKESNEKKDRPLDNHQSSPHLVFLFLSLSIRREFNSSLLDFLTEAIRKTHFFSSMINDLKKISRSQKGKVKNSTQSFSPTFVIYCLQISCLLFLGAVKTTYAVSVYE